MIRWLFANSTKKQRVFYIALLSLAGAIVAGLVVGTIYGLARNSAGTVRRSAAQTGESDDIRVFSGMGRLRIPLANSSVLVVSIVFPYSASDMAFTEELAAKIGDFKSVANGYFSSLPPEDTIQIDEDAAKREILRRFNSGLRLGKIETLYFSDMMIIDGSL